MTYKDDLHNNFIQKWIYYKIRLNKIKDNIEDYEFFDRGFYRVSELIKFLMYWNKIETYAKYPKDFINLVWFVSPQSLRYNIIVNNKYIHLKKWYYNKKALINYLINY